MSNAQELPSQIGPYRILNSLGKGGMGMVYHAVHSETQQHVALKTVRVAQSKFLHQIRREIHTLSQLRHPGIVTILDHGIEDGNPWYAMELIRGVTLREYCWSTAHNPESSGSSYPASASPSSNQVRLDISGSGHSYIGRAVAALEEKLQQESDSGTPWWTQTLAESWSWDDLTREVKSPSIDAFSSVSGEFPSKTTKIASSTPHQTVKNISIEHLHRVMEIMWKICSPLSYIHGEGIVHCDLKPSNILVRDDGWPVIIDFGLLTQFSNLVSRETLDTLQLGLGTLPYMAPEQLDGALLDARADLYAMGCLLYELLTGRPPFTGDPSTIVVKHLSEMPRPPSHRTHGIPPALDRLVLRLLAKKPQGRLGYADTMRFTLRSHITSIQMPAPTEWPGVIPPTPRMYLYRPGFAGRKDSFAILEQQVHQLRDGEGGILLLQGESGVGKTRIILELASLAMTSDVKVITGECLDHHSQPFEVFQPFFQAVADRARVQGKEETLRLLGKEGWSLLPFSPAFQDLPSQESLPTLVDAPPEQVKHMVSRALQHMLQVYSEYLPLLLLLDDLQWADPLTQEAIAYLAASDPIPNVMIVGTFRSEEVTEGLKALAQHKHITNIQLDRLDLEAVGTMVRDMLALSEIPEGFSRYLTHQSEGNPFFVAEYLRAAVEAGLLWRNPQGHWQIGSQAASMDLSPSDSQIPLPSSLRGLVTRRLSDLSPKALELMSAAAVMGREVSLFLLQTMTQFSQEQLWDVLEELSRRELLVEATQETLRFAHGKLREVMLDTFTEEQRKKLHHQAAVTIESCHGHNLDAFNADLSHHWLLAGEPDQAQYYAKRAAELAKQQHINDEAIQHYKTYLKLEKKATEEGVKIRLDLGDVLKLVGRINDAEKAYKQAVALSQKMKHRRLEGESQSKLGLLHWHTGRLDTGQELFEAALQIHKEVGHRKMEGMTTGYLAGLYYYRGDFPGASQTYQEALAIHREVGNRTAEGRDLSNLGNVFFEQNELDTALNYYTAALHLLDEPGSKRYRNLVLNNIAHVHHYRGETDTADKYYQEMLQDARARGDISSEGMALGNIAHLYRDLGKLEDARHNFNEALKIHRRVGNRLFEAVHRIHQLTLDRLLGQSLTTLKATLMSSETLLRNTGETFYLTLAFCEAGHIKLANLQSAEEELKKAEEKAAIAGVTAQSPTEIGLALLCLQNAQRAFLNDEFLYCGQRIDDIPPGLRQRLDKEGYLP